MEVGERNHQGLDGSFSSCIVIKHCLYIFELFRRCKPLLMGYSLLALKMDVTSHWTKVRGKVGLSDLVGDISLL
jgi:hypothetical protein